MVEMELEVEASAPVEVGHPVDDDLINYDSDVPDVSTSHNGKAQDDTDIHDPLLPPSGSFGAEESHTNGHSEHYEHQTGGQGEEELAVGVPDDSGYTKAGGVDIDNNASGLAQLRQPEGYVPPDEVHFGQNDDAQVDADFPEADIAAPVPMDDAEDQMQADTGYAQEEQEITWEQDDHGGDDAPEGGESRTAEDTQQYTQDKEASDAKAEATQYDAENGVVREAAVTHGAGVAAEDPATAEEPEGPFADDENQISQDDVMSTPLNFPAITVHYKGDDYPCFALSSEGFFTDVAILESSIKSLLEGFRAELAGELLPNEDLVFQVDELGLEFSESSSEAVLSDTTMRQILEVYDVLVKNQDPESTRTLYTYLFTRPSTGKRLEFLVESATEGRGLDEVIHLFHHPSHIAATTTDQDDYLPQFEEYESPDDDLRNDDTSGQEVGQKAYDTRDQSMFGEDTNNGEAEPGEGQPEDTEVTEAGDSGTGFEQEFNPVEEAVGYAFPDGEPQEQEPDEGFDAAEVGDSAAAMMADLEESEQAPADQDTTSAFDGQAVGGETSASTTIQGDDDPHATARTNEQAAHNNSNVENSADADELDEIDWRDDEGFTEPSIPVKRPHGDAELDLDHSQSVKRQRS